MALGTVSAAWQRIGQHGYADLPSMLEAANLQRSRSSTATVDPRAVFFHADAEALPGAASVDSIGVDLGGGVVARGFTDWSQRQVGTLCGVPARVQDRLTPATLARVLNETYPRDDSRSFLLESPEDGGDPRVRAVTSTGYRRVWDAELLGDVERWLAPNGWVPAFPTVNASGPEEDRERALWRSDRESFAFFMSERDASRPGSSNTWGTDDGLGGLRRGLYVGNSEVGARSLQWGRFWFRALCSNFLVWDVEEVRQHRRRHTAGVVREVHALRTWIRDVVPTVTGADLQPFEVAARTAFPMPEGKVKGRGRSRRRESPSDALGALLAKRYGLGVGLAKDAAERALVGDDGAQAGTWWAVVNGVTAAARDLTAGDRLEASAAAGRIMADAVGA